MGNDHHSKSRSLVEMKRATVKERRQIIARYVRNERYKRSSE
jgi:hypothetical protein